MYGGNDTLVGGKGDDLLSGGAGNETYVCSVGDGYDEISNYDNTGIETLRPQGARKSQIWISLVGRSLKVSIIGQEGEA